MKIQSLIKELETSPHFKTFKEKNPDSFFTAAFLILNLEDPTQNQIQLDYFLPKKSPAPFDGADYPYGEIAAFTSPFIEEAKIHDDIISVKQGQTTPKKIESMKPQELGVNPDIQDLQETCQKIIEENGSKITPTKIIAILKENIWNLTLMDNALSIIRIKINSKTGETLDFNKGGLMDFMGIKKKSN